MQQLEQAAEAARTQRQREVRYRWDDDGTLVLTARLPAEQGAFLLRALEAAGDALREQKWERERKAPHSSAEDKQPVAEHPDAPVAHRADALLLMAESMLKQGAAELTAAERHQVVVHVDATALAGHTHEGRCEIEHGPGLALETVRRMLCDSSVVPMSEAADGTPLDVGRKTRTVSPALRRALASRDGGCRFPGCTRRRFTDAHHIEHWVDGGETKLQNLVLLCRVHHRLLHEEGFSIEHTKCGIVFRAPDGRKVEEMPAARLVLHDPVLALMHAHAALGITARTCIPEWMGEVPDYEWITGLLVQREEAKGMAGPPS